MGTDYTIVTPLDELRAWKTDNTNYVRPGEYGTYEIRFDNTGNTSAADFCLVDYLPPELEATQISTGGWSFTGSSANITLSVDYQTNLNSSWTNAASGIGDDDNIVVGLSPLMGAGEYATAVRICFGPDAIPGGYQTYADIELGYRVLDNAAPGLITNCVTHSSSDQGGLKIQGNPCDDTTVEPAYTDPIPNPNPNKWVMGGYTNN